MGERTERSLLLSRNGEELFSSTGSWLYPLFDLERFLTVSGIDPGACDLYDKLIGKAAALLIVRLGIRRLTTGILSTHGEKVLAAHGLEYRTRERVEKILCRTEALLSDIDDPDTAYAVIRERIEENG